MGLTPRDIARTPAPFRASSGNNQPTGGSPTLLSLAEVRSEFESASKRLEGWILFKKGGGSMHQEELFRHLATALRKHKAVAAFAGLDVPSGDWVANHLKTVDNVMFKLSPKYTPPTVERTPKSTLSLDSRTPSSWNVHISVAVSKGLFRGVATQEHKFDLEVVPVLWLAILPALRLLQASYHPPDRRSRVSWLWRKQELPVYHIGNGSDDKIHGLLYYALQAGAYVEGHSMQGHAPRSISQSASSTEVSPRGSRAGASGGIAAAHPARWASVISQTPSRNGIPAPEFDVQSDNCDGRGTRSSRLKQGDGTYIWRYDSLDGSTRYVWVKADKTGVRVEPQENGTFKAMK